MLGGVPVVLPHCAATTLGVILTEAKGSVAPMYKPSFAYLVRCTDGSLYAGWTNDPDARLAAHNNGTGAKYTRARRPVTLVYLERCEDKRAAMRRELALKRMARAQKLALIAAHPAKDPSLCCDSN